MSKLSNLIPDASSVSVLIACPLCGGASEFVCDSDLSGVGIRCINCGMSIPPNHANSIEAAATWNRRQGSAKALAALGGAATRGLSTPRKRAASRRNLKKARARKKLKRIQAGIEIAYTRLKQARRAEQADVEAAAARSYARLMDLESLIQA
jgi:Na+-translocating ferredoxin:NAD+ oxidoreductase RnfC subunit